MPSGLSNRTYEGRALEIHQVVRSSFMLFTELPAKYFSALLIGESKSPFRWESSIAVFLRDGENGKPEFVFISSTGNFSIALRANAERCFPGASTSVFQRGILAYIPKIRFDGVRKLFDKLSSVCITFDRFAYHVSVSPEDFRRLRSKLPGSKRTGVANRAKASVRGKPSWRSGHGQLAAGSMAEHGQLPWFPLSHRFGVQSVASGGAIPVVHPCSMSELMSLAGYLGMEFLVVPDYHRGIGIVSFCPKKSPTKMSDMVAFVKLIGASSGLIAHPFVPRWIDCDFHSE